MKYSFGKPGLARVCGWVLLCVFIWLCTLPASLAADAQLAAPQHLQSSATTSYSITMAWDEVPGADYYRFYLDGTYIANVRTTSYTCADLLPDTVYGFKVAAVDSQGVVGLYSEYTFGRTRTEPLAAPGSLRAETVTADSVSLVWSAVPGAEYYRFYRDGNYVEDVLQTSHTCTGLSPDMVYGFKVAAVDANGVVGAYSDNVYFRTQALQLAAPQALHAAAVTPDTIVLEWDEVPGASYYRFYLDGSYLADALNASYRCTGLLPDTVYGFKVAAVDAKGNVGSYSGNIFIRTKVMQLAAPQALRDETITADSITLSWDEVPGASYYRFYLDGVYIADSLNTAYTCTDLIPDMVYGFKVAAVDAKGNVGQYSNNVYLRTAIRQLPAPENVHAAETTGESITMKWDAVPGASYYRFYRNGSFAGNVKGTSFTSKNLDYRTVYGFKVAAVDENGTLGLYSPHTYINTQSALLDPPRTMQVTAVTHSSVTVAWSGVYGASYYCLYLNGRCIGRVLGTDYTCTDLPAQTLFGFKVAGVSETGQEGVRSESLYARTRPENAVLQAFSEMVADIGSRGGLSVIFARLAAVNPRDGLLPATAYNFMQTEGAGMYTQQQPGNAGGDQKAPLATPRNLQADGDYLPGGSEVRMIWDAVADAALYRLYRDGNLIADTQETAWIDADIAYDTEYIYQVAAVDAKRGAGRIFPARYRHRAVRWRCKII